jgi:Fuc2NAc and GlcNAc transferase
MGFLAFFASAFLALVLVGVVRSIALRAGILDVPNSRSSHVAATPRGGGIAIVTITLAAAILQFGVYNQHWIWLLTFLVGGGIVALAGFLDDLRGLPALGRASSHMAAATLLVFAVGSLPTPPLPWVHIGHSSLGWIVPIIAIVWSINLFNFMDGIDGLAATQCAFVAGTGTVLCGTGDGLGEANLVQIALSGSALGFLVWNFPRARIFLGDVGSGFIGFGIAAGTLFQTGRNPGNVWAWIILNGLFISDATVTILVRLVHGQRIYQAHRSHAYQRLARRWNSHQAVTLLFVAINVCWCLPWAAVSVHQPTAAPLWASIALVPLIISAALMGAGRPDV